MQRILRVCYADATNRVLKEQSMVVRTPTETRDFGLATGWSEDGTTATYQPYARAVGSHRRIELPRAVQQRSNAPANYTRRPSGVQPKVTTPALEEYELLDLDELELSGNLAGRRSAASASVWNALGFAALFASVLIGRVIVEAGAVKHARSVETPNAAAGSVSPSSPPQPRPIEPTPRTTASEGSAAPEVDLSTARGERPATPGNVAPETQSTAAETSARRPARARSLQARAESSDWRDGPMEPAVSSITPEAAPNVALGTLRINSRPWSQVFIDGHLVGNTPQMGLDVPAGRHTVRLSNPELGMSKTIIVQVAAGERVTRVESLE